MPAVAESLPDAARPIDVWARVVFDRDGEQWLPGLAVRWTRHHVMVRLDDRRLQVGATWLSPHDLRRRRCG